MSIVGSVSVRVVPSFTGMHKTIGQQFSGAGAEAGRTFSRSMGASMDLRAVGGALQGVGDRVSSLGGRLTKSITVPAAGAAAAVGGIVGAFGWGRLKSVDSAQAQLRGLGYSTEDVTRISGQLTEALEGGMLTMGEATSAAAAGMAAGVEEGAELTRYIELLDAATAGSNGTFDEMNQIFARIQGSGQLMTNELQMIEQRMPGFSGAAAEHFDVTQEALREMVSNGEISADEFLDIMDSFAGDMATEYAKSWDGMVQNTKAYIGILGENLLGGVFEQSKDAIAEFIEFLSSDEVEQWATSAGEAIGEAFSSILDWVQRAITWWTNLDGSTQRLIGTLAGIAVAAGPVLLVVGKIISAIGGLISGVGVVVGWFSRLSTALLGSTSNLTLLPRILTLVGNAFRFITGPIGLVIGALVAAWTQSEAFRTAIVDMGKAIWDAFSGIWDALQPAFSGIGSALSGFGEIAAWAGEMLGDGLAWVIDTLIIPAIEWLGDAIAGVITWLTGLGDETTQQGGVMTSTWEWIQGAISAVVGWITDTAWPAIQAAWDGITAGVQWLGETAQTVWGAISTAIEVAYTIIATIITAIVAVFLFLGTTMWNIWTDYIKLVWDTWVSIITWVWESILQPIFGFIASAFQALGTAFMWVWDNVIKPMWDMFVELVRWVWESIIQPIFNFIVQSFKNVGTGFMVVWETFIKPVIDMVGAIIRWLWENVAEPIFGHISDSWQIMALWLRDVWRNTIRPMIEAFGDWVVNMWRNYIDPALGWISEKWDWLSGKISDFWNDGIKPTLEAFGNFFTDTLPRWVDKGVDKIRAIWEGVKRLFREPINWVIRNVVNKGLIGAFNKVAGFIPGVSKIGNVAEIGGSLSSGRSFAAGGGAARIAGARAEGGPVDPNKTYLVGEEGPELVTPSRHGWVHPADETQGMLGGIGGPGATAKLAQRLATSDTAVGEWGRDTAGNVVQWARGALKSAVDAVLKPIFDPLKSWASRNGMVGEFAVGTAESVKDKLLSWAQSDDEKMMADGFYDGPFTANPGGFNRPAQGAISSMAGRRSYFGAFGNMHYGVDIANAIGTAVRAAWSGVVKRVSGSGMNRTMVLNHGGFDTAYMHNSAHLVGPGDKVTGGQQIARMGTAGTGPHVHFEMHPGGYYNPSISSVNALFGGGGAGNISALWRDKGGLIYPGMNAVLNNTGQAEYAFNQRQFDNLVAATQSGGQVSSGGDTYHVHGNLDQAYKLGQEIRFTKRAASRRRVGV